MARRESDALPRKIEELDAAIAARRSASGGKADNASGGKADKASAKAIRKLEADRNEARDEFDSLSKRIQNVLANPVLAKLAEEHPDIEAAVLAETARLHAGDAENRRLWEQFLPHSEKEIERIYGRLGVQFDHTLGESFYHDRLGPLVEELLAEGIARRSEGAVCIFLEGRDVPMIIRKQDGAFLYATTDLATLRYRMETWRPTPSCTWSTIARACTSSNSSPRRGGWATPPWNWCTSVSEPSSAKTGVRSKPDRATPSASKAWWTKRFAAPPWSWPPTTTPSPTGRNSRPTIARIAETVGTGALKYADLSQNRTSDYVFSYDKMLAMNGNTATYMQYAYARVRAIFRRQKIDIEAHRAAGATIVLGTPAERALGLELLRFGEALDLAAADYRPNQLTGYLFDLANRYSTFYENCPVLRRDGGPPPQPPALVRSDRPNDPPRAGPAGDCGRRENVVRAGVLACPATPKPYAGRLSSFAATRLSRPARRTQCMGCNADFPSHPAFSSG